LNALLLSLGHGASACLVDASTGQVRVAFENERLTGVKSDSQFPIEAINKCMEYAVGEETVIILVSHWGIGPEEFMVTSSKYWRPNIIKSAFPGVPVAYVNDEFSHHDAHMESAAVFAGKDFLDDKVLGIVCDGFGTRGETLSAYTFKDGERKNVFRHFGFKDSLGLFYQFSTSFLGLKENQDEYKLLGYEAHILDCVDLIDFAAFTDIIGTTANSILKSIQSKKINEATDPLITLGALPQCKLQHRMMLQDMLDKIEVRHMSGHQRRIVVAHFTQRVVERVLEKFISGMSAKLDTTKLLVSGGVFMNVALNNRLLGICDSLCVMPLCGDQGAPIGLYNQVFGNFVWPDHLFWGDRGWPWHEDGDVARHLAAGDTNVQSISQTDLNAVLIAERINAGQIVNLVGSAMEFGSRALGNTSSLMLPTKENVDKINSANNRASIMPCAPVVRDQDVHKFFNLEQLGKVHKSLEYMICTIDYLDGEGEKCLGAAHSKPFESHNYTGRVQILKEETHPFLYRVLGLVEGNMVVNTSFNYHGQPICYNKFVDVDRLQNQEDPNATSTFLLEPN